MIVGFIGTRDLSEKLKRYIKMIIKRLADGTWICSGGADGTDSFSVSYGLKKGHRAIVFLPLHEINNIRHKYGRKIQMTIPSIHLDDCLMLRVFPNHKDITLLVPGDIHTEYHLVGEHFPYRAQHYHWRNAHIAETSKKIFAFHHGNSANGTGDRGTMSTIRFARKYKTPVIEVSA